MVPGIESRPPRMTTGKTMRPNAAMFWLDRGQVGEEHTR